MKIIKYCLVTLFFASLTTSLHLNFLSYLFGYNVLILRCFSCVLWPELATAP